MVERLAAGIFEQQHGSTTFALERQRPYRPRVVQLILQFVFVGETSKAGGGWVRRSGQHGQDGASSAVGASAPPPAKDAIVVLPQDLEVALHRSVEPNGQGQLPHSAAKVFVAIELSSELICSEWPKTA
jgi:hypothetical protein